MTAAGTVYSDIIRDRWRRPRFRGELANATATAEDVNPLCGDRVRVSLRLEGSAVTAVRFMGDACAICLAAADVVAELAEGRTRDEALTLSPDDVLEVLRADIRPTRQRCVALPVGVLATALREAR